MGRDPITGDTFCLPTRYATTMPRRRALGPTLVSALLLVSLVAGCIHSKDFRARISNGTDQAHTATVSLTAIRNGTEAYNRTFDVGADEKVPMEGFPPWRANFTAWARLDDGRTDNTTLESHRFCGGCIVALIIDDDDFSFTWSVS